MRIIFMGTPDFAVASLEQLVEQGYDIVGVYTQPDRPKGRKQVITPSPVKVAAEKFGIPVYQPERIRKEEEVLIVRELKPDLIVTAAYGQILPRALLDIPHLGCINVHASLLPRNRGGAPIHWSIIRGEKETGVTIMYMVEALDAGDMISKVVVPITDDDNVGTLHDKLALAGADLLIETLPKLIAGEMSPEAQSESLVTYSTNIKRDDEKLNWNKTNREIYNQIRGLSPWPVAYTTLENEVWKIWGAQLGSNKPHLVSTPGTIIEITDHAIEVATGEGSILLIVIQPA
ncbi:MAG: methionyl-tRNA formyltransferase [Bacilli bacterium]